jgi:hypothetical protein
MANLDPAISARVTAQLEANPQFQEFRRRLGTGRFNAGAISPRMFGIDSPDGYVYSLSSRQLVPETSLADKVLPAVGGAVLGYGALSALGGTGAAGASGPAAGLDTSIGGAAGLDLPGFIPGTAPLGGMSVAPAAAAGGGNALAGAGKDFLKDLASPQGAASLAALIAGLKGQSSGDQNTEELRRIQAITEARMRRADPLHQVAVNLAFGRLPTNYRQGVQMNNVPLPGGSNG